MDEERVKKLVRELIIEIGEDPTREGLRDTPKRIANMYKEIFGGYDSDSEFANSLKILVEKKLNEGLDEKQIYDYLKNKYGDWILYDPGFSKNTYFLWLLPILMFIFGGAIILRKVILKKKKLLII